MVHRKSEYMLQYQILSKDLRKQIWEDNANFRSDLRDVNRADHYWKFQLTNENCICDDQDSKEGELKSLQRKNSTRGDLLQSMNVCSSANEAQSRDSIREVGVQTPDWEKTEQRARSLDFTPKKASVRTTKDSKRSKKNDIRRLEPTSKIATSTLPHRYTHFLNQCYQPKLHIPTRTDKDIYLSGQKSCFAPFGYKVTESDVGKNKTFNVCAPEKEALENGSDSRFQNIVEGSHNCFSCIKTEKRSY